MNVYHAQLLDHYRNPRNRGTLEQPTFTVQENNPLCGDQITMCGTVTDSKLTQVAFIGYGCVISQATASLLTEHVLQKSIGAIVALTAQDITNLIGMDLGPTRLKCALLPLQALLRGLE